MADKIIALERMSHRRRLRMRRNEFVRRMMEQMRSPRRRSTANPRSRQQLRPRTLPQRMGRSVLVRMMKQVLQQRRLIPSPRSLSKLHDTLDLQFAPRFLFAFVRDGIKGVKYGMAALWHKCFSRFIEAL
jgi:hypothetical protein